MNTTINNQSAAHGLTEDQLCISVLEFDLIKAAANGLVDLNELARNHMANCGLDLDGKWVGHEAAAETICRKY